MFNNLRAQSSARHLQRYLRWSGVAIFVELLCGQGWMVLAILHHAAPWTPFLIFGSTWALALAAIAARRRGYHRRLKEVPIVEQARLNEQTHLKGQQYAARQVRKLRWQLYRWAIMLPLGGLAVWRQGWKLRLLVIALWCCFLVFTLYSRRRHKLMAVESYAGGKIDVIC